MLKVSARSGLWFLLVGGGATLAHMLTFSVLHNAMWPELANACGFVVAFSVSFLGHRFLTFPDTKLGFRTSLVRFVATSVLGFVTNELVFTVALRWAHWLPTLALVLGLSVAAVQTFVLGRLWAFGR